MGFSGKLKKNRIEKMVAVIEIGTNLFLKSLVVFEGRRFQMCETYLSKCENPG
jgi:hypothetical protein